ncbi:MAG TPA: iron ABC transporter permease [Acidimicrobiales bacterium]|nr:iron ABC transporter permease [Acidimicrobiales bacterium]
MTTIETLRSVGAGRRRRFPWLLSVASVLVVLVLLSPLALIIVQAVQAGGRQVWSLLDRSFVATLLWNTVRLAVVVTVLTALIGTGAAWLTERTALPGRRAWEVLLIIPIVIPDFVLAWTWSSVFPAVHGFWGAVLVMTLHLYPLVYLPMAAAFRAADPGQEEAARSLGLSRLSAWLRISVRQARTTLLGGCLLVCLALLAYYGAFENLRYQTFTTAIFGELQTSFAPAVASALSLVLVALSVLVLAGEAVFRERGRLQRSGPMVPRPHVPVPLGRWMVVAELGLGALVGLALAFPVAVVVYWMAAGGSSTVPAAVSFGAAIGYTVLYSALGALIATALALPVSLLATRHQRRWSAALERSTFVVQAVPGVVVGLALVYLAAHYMGFLYQSPELLVAAYALMFFPLGLVAVSASVARASPRLEEAGRSLGRGPLAVRLHVTLPLLAPGIAAAFCFVFLTAVTELTATLLLVPTGVQTLATQFWAYAEEGVSFGAAAPYAATMMVMSVVPAFLLGRWFDRRFSTASGGTSILGGGT